MPDTKSRSISYTGKLRLLMLPYLLGILLLVFLPGILSFVLAFFQYDALSPPVWVGKLNFSLAFTDELFLLSVRNSIALVIFSVPARVFGAFTLARLMQKKGRFLSWLRASIYLPTIIPAPAYALAWLWILNPIFGPMNLLLGSLGILPPGWFADPVWAKPALILMSFWQIGEGFLISLAVLEDFPLELEDAARIDGANSWKIFWQMIVPMMSPALMLLSFRDIILSLQENLTTILLTTNGGPYYSTYTLPYFIYEQGFDLLSFGTASAIMWVLYIMTGLMTLVLYSLFKGKDVSVLDELFFA